MIKSLKRNKSDDTRLNKKKQTVWVDKTEKISQKLIENFKKLMKSDTNLNQNENNEIISSS